MILVDDHLALLILAGGVRPGEIEDDRIATTSASVAARMHTSQSAVARLESGGGIDAKLSTVERYAADVGKKINWQLADA